MSTFRLRTAIAAVAVGLATGIAAVAVDASPANAEADDCPPGMLSDFNGDGYSDTVIADPYATVGGELQAGRLSVLYGDADGRIGEGPRSYVQQGSGVVGDVPETGDRFGTAVAVADVNCDDYTDVVVGTPYEDIGGQVDSGSVQIVWGYSTGLGLGIPARQLGQSTFGNAVVAGDQFGFAVDALEDVGQGSTGGEYAYALAIGAPGTNVSGLNDAGWVGFEVAYDGENEPVEVTQDTPGVPGAAEAGDRFGAAVSLNYLTGITDVVDAVVGVPNEDVGSLANAGAITVVRDIYYSDDVQADGFDQNSPGVADSAEAGDVFGRTLDSILVGGTSRMVVGVPGEDLGAAANAGAVQLFAGPTTSITPTAFLSQDTPGVGGAPESQDGFGNRVAFIGPGLADPYTRLAVSTPTEDGEAVDSGLVQVFPLTDLSTEVSYSQGSPGVPGAVTAGDRFGTGLAFVAGVTERALVVGVPDDADHPTGMVNVIPLGGGVPRFWAPGVGGVPGAGASRFGDPLGNVSGGTT